MYVATFLLRLLGQLDQVIDDLAAVIPAIGYVTGLYKVGFATFPFTFFVNQARRLHDLQVLSVVAMQVTYRNNPLHAGPMIVIQLFCLCHGEAGQQQ